MTAPLTRLSEEEQIFRDSVRAFADKELAPRAARQDAQGHYDPDLVPKLFELGVMAIETPQEWGGAGGSFFLSVLAIEELSRADAAVAVLVDAQNTLVANALLRFAAPELKQRVLSRMASGTVASYALSEAGSGSDAFALATRAVEDGDAFVLSGRKLWITNAVEAGVFLVMANANPGAGYRGITSFVVEKGMRGFSVGRKEDKLGIRASSTCELVLDGVRVPRANVVGKVGQGYKIAIETLNGAGSRSARRWSGSRRARSRTRSPTPPSASSSAKRSARSRRCSSSWRSSPPRSRPRGSWSTTRRG